MANGRGRESLLGLVLGLATGSAPVDGRAAEDLPPAASLREAAARRAAACPEVGSAAETGRPKAASPTCCTAGCREAPPSADAGCAGALNPDLAIDLGLALGSGLGLGLGLGEGSHSLAKEFQPFGLTDSLITAGAVAIAWKGHELVDPVPPPLCEGPFSGCRGKTDAIGGLDAYVRREWVWPSFRGRATAHALSNATLLATFALPASFLLASDAPQQGREMWLTLESAAITSAVLQVVKHRVNRPRPYAHYCEPGCGEHLGDRDTQLSFFSGHTALSFSLAVSAGTIASMRSYRNAGFILGSGLALATTTGYFRIAADKHYFTDVLAGAFVGSAIGWAVPHIHGTRTSAPQAAGAARRRAESPALLVPVPLRGPTGGLWLHGGIARGGTAFAVSWSF